MKDRDGVLGSRFDNGKEVIEGSEVRILHIRRATMDTASPSDLEISP
jgi:hypothetical protein